MRITALNMHTYHTYRDRGGEKNSGVSQTVPDQVLPLATLLARYTRGQSVPLHNTDFDDDEHGLALRPLSRIEALEALHENTEYIVEAQREAEVRAKAKKATTPPPPPPSPVPDDEI